MRSITSFEMEMIDANCEYHGLSRLQLMENAGRGLAEEIERRGFKKIVIFAGRGNNGGDAFVAARHLKGEIEVYLLGKEKDIRTEIAKRNFELLKKCNVKIREITDASMLPERIDAEVIVDAIFGTGVHHPIREPERSAIRLMNRSDAFIISVDVPSGMNPDDGSGEEVVKADLVVTFHRMKKGLESLENVVVKGIGISEELEELAGPGELKVLMKRDEESHKGDNGRILVIGGGEFTGAPALTALAALRCGADWVTLAVPERIKSVVASFSPNLIVRGYEGEYLTEKNVELLGELVEKHDITVIGMGLGRREETKEAVREILKMKSRFVVDADALHAISEPLEMEAILTPHRGEFGVLGGEISQSFEEMKENVRKVAERLGAVILLKGRRDIISDGEKIKVNLSGNPGMTVGGTGDVLAGIVAALWVKESALYAASGGAFLCGLAGDIAYSKKGYSLLATDVIESIPEALERIRWVL